METAVQVGEGALAACGAVVVSNPFEVVKTRLQLQGELQTRGAGPRPYKGLWHGMRVIAANEGLRGVQKGLPAALCYQTLMNGVRLGFYEPTKRLVTETCGVPAGVPANLLAGGTLGFVGSYVGNPLFLVKTRQQASAATAAGQVGKQHAYRGCADGLRTILREGGPAGLMHGAYTAAVRTGAGGAVQLASYDFFKGRFAAALDVPLTDYRLHFASSFCASWVVTSVMNPFDVVMTRTYNNAGGTYSGGFVASFAKIAQAEGLGGLYKGALALWARICPHTVLSLVFLERIRATRRRYWGTFNAAPAATDAASVVSMELSSVE